MRFATKAVLAVLVLMLAACSPKIYGTLQLMDPNLQPIPPPRRAPKARW